MPSIMARLQPKNRCALRRNTARGTGADMGGVDLLLKTELRAKIVSEISSKRLPRRAGSGGAFAWVLAIVSFSARVRCGFAFASRHDSTSRLPFPPGSAGAIINVHYTQPTLFR